MLRKRREATRGKQTASRSDTKSTDDLSEQTNTQHTPATAEKKKADTVVKESVNSVNENDSPDPKHVHNNLQDKLASSEISFISHKGLRRRKRDAVMSSNTFSETLDQLSNTQTVSQEITSTSESIQASSAYASSTGINPSASFPFYNYVSSSYDASSSDDYSPSVAMSSSAYNNTHWSSYYYDDWAAWYDYYDTSYKPYWYDNYYNYDSYWYDWYMDTTWSDSNEGGSFFFDQLRSKKDEWDERVEKFRTVFKNETL